MKNSGGNKEKCIIIQSCRNCSQHSYHTHHIEQKYYQYVEDLKNQVNGKFEDIELLHNMMKQSQVESLKMLQRERQWDMSKAKYVHVKPRVGSFQVFFNSYCIFSKLKSGVWPNIPQLAKKLEKIISHFDQQRDITEFTINLNRGRRFQNRFKLRSSSCMSSTNSSPLRLSANRSIQRAGRAYQQSIRSQSLRNSYRNYNKFKSTQSPSSTDSPYRAHENHGADSDVTSVRHQTKKRKKKSIDEDPEKNQFLKTQKYIPQLEETKGNEYQSGSNSVSKNKKKFQEIKEEEEQKYDKNKSTNRSSYKSRGSPIQRKKTPVKKSRQNKQPRYGQRASAQYLNQEEQYEKHQILPPIQIQTADHFSEATQKKQKPRICNDESSETKNKATPSDYQANCSQQFEKSMQQKNRKQKNIKIEANNFHIQQYKLIDDNKSDIKPIQLSRINTNEDAQFRYASRKMQRRQQEDGSILEITKSLYGKMDKNDQPSMVSQNNLENPQIRASHAEIKKQEDGQLLEILKSKQQKMDKNDQPSLLAANKKLENPQIRASVESMHKGDGQILEILKSKQQKMDKNDQPSLLAANKKLENPQIRASVESMHKGDGQLLEILKSKQQKMDKNDQPSLLNDNKVLENPQIRASVESMQKGDGQLLEIAKSKQQNMDKNDQPSLLAENDLQNPQIGASFEKLLHGDGQISEITNQQQQQKMDKNDLPSILGQNNLENPEIIANLESLQKGDGQILEIAKFKQQNMDKNDLPSILGQNNLENPEIIANVESLQRGEGQILEIETIQHQQMDKNEQPSVVILNSMDKNQSELGLSVYSKNEINDSAIDEDQIKQEEKKILLPQLEDQIAKEDKHQSIMDQIAQKSPSELNQIQQEHDQSKLQGPQFMSNTFQSQSLSVNAFIAQNLIEKALNLAKESLENDDQIQSQISKLTQSNRKMQQNLVINNSNNIESIKKQSSQRDQSINEAPVILHQSKSEIPSFLSKTNNSQIISHNATLAQNLLEKALNIAKESLENDDQLLSQMSRISSINKSIQQQKLIEEAGLDDSFEKALQETNKKNMSLSKQSNQVPPLNNQTKFQGQSLMSKTIQSQSTSVNAFIAKNMIERALDIAKSSFTNQDQIQSNMKNMSLCKQSINNNNQEPSSQNQTKQQGQSIMSKTFQSQPTSVNAFIAKNMIGKALSLAKQSFTNQDQIQNNSKNMSLYKQSSINQAPSSHNQTKQQGQPIMSKTLQSQSTSVNAFIAKNMIEKALSLAKQSFTNQDQIQSEVSKILSANRKKQQSKMIQYTKRSKSFHKALSKLNKSVAPSFHNSSIHDVPQVVYQNKQQVLQKSIISQISSVNAFVAKNLIERALNTAKQSLRNQYQAQSQMSRISTNSRVMQQQSKGIAGKNQLDDQTQVDKLKEKRDQSKNLNEIESKRDNLNLQDNVQKKSVEEKEEKANQA